MNFIRSYSKSDRIVLFTIIYFNIFLLYPLFQTIFVSSITDATLNLLICSNSPKTNLNPGLLKRIINTLKIIILAGGYDDDFASVETSIYQKLNDIDSCGY